MSTQVYNQALVSDDQVPWTTVEPGVQRKVMSYNESMMLVKVRFETGATGALHHHPHLQMSYVAGGVFEVSMGGEKRTLKQGDVYFALPDVVHGVVCLEAGLLVDVFSPARADFLVE